jgi:histidine triad (HIT) family protein
VHRTASYLFFGHKFILPQLIFFYQETTSTMGSQTLIIMNYSGNDFYCDIAIPRKVDLKIEYESENVLAFHHTKPFWPIHIVVIPKKHIYSFTTLGKEDAAVFLEIVEVLKNLARKTEEEEGAARILTNLGKYQDSKHLHFHISSGEPLR